jgi:hypothetical protein
MNLTLTVGDWPLGIPRTKTVAVFKMTPALRKPTVLLFVTVNVYVMTWWQQFAPRGRVRFFCAGTAAFLRQLGSRYE